MMIVISIKMICKVQNFGEENVKRKRGNRMTREEAIKILDRDDDDMRKGYFCINDFLAIEALKSGEPCENCVSRASVFEIIGNLLSIPYDFDRPINEDDVKESMEGIRALPLVTPKRKAGKWIYHEMSKSTGFKTLRECSCCKSYFDWDMPRNSYCPHCGAEMESEE